MERDTTVVVESSCLHLLPSGRTAGLDPMQVRRTPRRGHSADPGEEQRPRTVRWSARILQPPPAERKGCLVGWIAHGSPLVERPEHPQAYRWASLGRALPGGDAAAFSSRVGGLLSRGQGPNPSEDD